MLNESKISQNRVNGILIDTWIVQMNDACVLELEIGSTGFKGGDTGHGGRTYFRLKNMGAADLDMQINEDSNELVLKFGGDAELSTFIDALEFATGKLKDSIVGTSR